MSANPIYFGSAAWIRAHRAENLARWPRRGRPWTRTEERALTRWVKSPDRLWSVAAHVALTPVAAKLGRTVWGCIARIQLLREVAERSRKT